ncbi:hypothetical protein EIP91_005001 [Steccherinum ochraceum]|uniref:NAD-dependent epimerase/dehydratase domain-containing protein n=1 Tax=Steccherinum ochraceum TaxID=92696 RepID=A0A4R0R7U2_9APHY|nr:hypothetical protein EIP91_005001 [Steccherinum ochraceum]
MSSQLVLVTGVSGYLGSHVVDQLVAQGYRVRGTVRSAKVPANKEAFAVYGDAVEIIGMDDLVHGEYPDAFVGVDAVIHVAAPLAGRVATAEEALDVAIDGSLNVFRQAEKAGIRTFSYASSIVAHSVGFLEGDFTMLTGDEWLPITKEDVLNDKAASPFLVYKAEKVLSERAVWEFADQHPHIELTTVNPPFFYGPFAPGYKAPFQSPTASVASLSSMSMPMLYTLLHPHPADDASPSPCLVDVRDVARALVAALSAPPTPLPAEIAQFLVAHRPELAGRLNEKFKSTHIPGLKEVVDGRRLKEVLGLEVVPWRKTILDGVDALVELERVWKERGVTYARESDRIRVVG